MFKSSRPDGSTDALSSRRVLRHLISRARIAQNDKRYADAATLYGEALRLSPRRANLHIQLGHMLKEAGELGPAEHHYLEAFRLTPNDPDLSLQLGHFYKIAARLDKATEAYERAVQLRPKWDEPARELAFLRRSGWRGQRHRQAGDGGTEAACGPDDHGLGGRKPSELARLVPGLAPRPPEDLLREDHERIDVRRLGRREVGYWGNRRTLRGVEAIHGYCLSHTPLLEMQVLVNGVAIHRGPLKGGYAVAYERVPSRIRKYVFNTWLDFSGVANGLHSLELRFFDAGEATRSFHDDVVVAEPLPEAAHPRSNALVEVSHDDPRSVEDQVRSRPSMVRSATRPLFPHGVRSMLVLRTDQLGDMVASVPAVQRLREIAPGARIVGLLTPANADLARTLGLFDEVIVIDFTDDKAERRRVISLDAQEALRRRLEPYAFDIAIDLADSDVSRDLLRLTGARFLYGKGGGDRPWLSADIMSITRDPWSGIDCTPHSAKVLTLVEGLGALLNNRSKVIRRTDLSREILQQYGIASDEAYALIHTGARIPFSRWPHFATVAAMLLEKTNLKVVWMGDDVAARKELPDELLAHGRFVFLGGPLPFDHFDAIVSFATVMAGNDSGPKHLAALRGTNVVAVFTARHSWVEWGQEIIGTVISRRVPCAGCLIFHNEEDCGKDFACVADIKPDEVFEAMMAYLAQPQGALS